VIALNVNHPPAGDVFESAKLEPNEWIVRFQGQTFDKTSGGKTLDDGRYIDEWSLFRNENYVRVPVWYGRLGNNLHQLFHAIVYAESQNITLVKIPQRPTTLNEIFDLPAEFSVHPRFSSDSKCTFDKKFFFEYCEVGYKKEDFRRALLTYVKPHIKQNVNSACQSKLKAQNDLVIHLRGGDLAVSAKHPQSRMQPCSFYSYLIATHNFSSVTLVVEDGEHDQFCREYILTAFNGSTVLVKETDHSLIDDVCTLLTSQYITFGLTTFAESLAMMNEHVKKIYVPAVKFNFNNFKKERRVDDVQYGSKRDMSGALECDGSFSSCTKGFIEYALYDIPGFAQIRSSASRTEYVRQEGINYSQLKTCGHCIV
jgi:hypothetical protein